MTALAPLPRRTPARTWSALAVCALVLAGGARAARAQAQNTIEGRETEAKKDCLARHTDRGIELLAGLYAETNDPTYIYNQARCYQQGGKAQEALVSFREYLRKAPNLPADEKAQVEGYINELEAQVRQPQSRPAPAPNLTPHPTPGGQPVDLVARSAEESPIYKRWWFWTGVGALIAGAAVVAVVATTGGGGPSPYRGNFDPGTASIPSQ